VEHVKKATDLMAVPDSETDWKSKGAYHAPLHTEKVNVYPVGTLFSMT